MNGHHICGWSWKLHDEDHADGNGECRDNDASEEVIGSNSNVEVAVDSQYIARVIHSESNVIR
jgi:hypothetical protein